MSPSSTGDSPSSLINGHSSATAAATTTASNPRPFPLQARGDGFTIEIPSPQLNAVNHALKSPNSAKTQRTPSFSRDGILGSVQKVRNMSQSSENHGSETNGMQKVPSDEGINPLKRRNTDAGVDYPRRRATIAVCDQPPEPVLAKGERCWILRLADFFFPDRCVLLSLRCLV